MYTWRGNFPFSLSFLSLTHGGSKSIFWVEILYISGHHPDDRRTQIFIYVQTRAFSSTRVHWGCEKFSGKLYPFTFVLARANEEAFSWGCKNDNDFSYFPPKAFFALLTPFAVRKWSSKSWVRIMYTHSCILRMYILSVKGKNGDGIFLLSLFMKFLSLSFLSTIHPHTSTTAKIMRVIFCNGWHIKERKSPLFLGVYFLGGGGVDRSTDFSPHFLQSVRSTYRRFMCLTDSPQRYIHAYVFVWRQKYVNHLMISTHCAWWRRESVCRLARKKRQKGPNVKT